MYFVVNATSGAFRQSPNNFSTLTLCCSAECDNHTIVPMATAIKRMCEILLLKANACARNLERASQNVLDEQDALEAVLTLIADRFGEES